MVGVLGATDKGPPEKEQARRETVEVMLTELKRALDKEFQAIEALDRKAGIILGSASLVVALMTVSYGPFLQRALEPSIASVCLHAGLVAGAVVYIRLIYCTVRAFGVTTYYLPVKLDVDEIENGYLRLNKAEVQEQLLAQYIEYSAVNSMIIDKKAPWLQKSLWLLAADTAYLTVLVIVGTLILAS